MGSELSSSGLLSPVALDARRLLAMVWVIGVLVIFFFVFDGWLWVAQFFHVVAQVESWETGPSFAANWTGWFTDVVFLLLTLALALGWGAWLADRVTPSRNLLSLLFAVGLGLWVVSVATLAVGWFSVWLLSLLFAGLLVWVLPGPRWFVRMTAYSSEKMDGWSKWMAAALVALAVLAGLAALNPPFEYDALEYHLGAPHEYLQAGQIVALPHNFYSNMPQLTEMLYLFGLTVKSESAAKLVHWLYGVMAAMAVYAAGTLLWSRRVGWTAAVLFYCLPFVQDVSRTARIDLATTFYGALAYAAMLAWWRVEREGDDRWLWMSALSAGLAVATKWTAIPVVVMPLLMFLAVATFYSEGRRWGGRCGRWVVFGVLATLPVTPWLVKNYLLMGNPVYPLFGGWLTSEYWTVEQSALFGSKHYATFDAAGWLSLVKLAWVYSFQEAGAAPVLLAFAPLVLLPRKLDASARHAAWLAAAVWVCWWAATYRPWRFMLPGCVVAAWAGAYAVDRLGREGAARWVLKGGLSALAGVCLSMAGLRLVLDARDAERVPPRVGMTQYLLGQVDRNEFVAQMGHGTMAPLLWMNENLPDDSVVMFVGEARPYYCRWPVVWSAAFDRHPLTELMRGVNDPVVLSARMRERKITHVYVNRLEWKRLATGYGYLKDMDHELFERWLREQTREAHRNGPLAVYQIRG